MQALYYEKKNGWLNQNVWLVAFVAQLIEHQTPNPRVVSSNLTGSNLQGCRDAELCRLYYKQNIWHKSIFRAVNCTSLCSTSVVMLSMLLLLTATLRIAKSSEKLFGTFGRDGWDYDPLIRVVIKNRGKSFLPSDFISGMVTQFMVSLRQLALYVGYIYG